MDTLVLKSASGDSPESIKSKLSAVMPKELSSLQRKDMTHKFVTPLGTSVIMQVIHIPLPKGLTENPRYPNMTDCCVCGGPKGSTPRIKGNVNFVAFNHFYVYHQFLSPWTREFDFFFKIDYDVWFNPNPGKRIEFSMMDKMRSGNKLFMHGTVESCCGESEKPTIFEMTKASLQSNNDPAAAR